MRDDAQADSRRHRVITRVRERRERHSERGRAYRISVAAVGFLLVALGLILALPLVPGPGLLLVAVGLAILALEFDWAERLLDRTLHRVERVAERAAPRGRIGRLATPLAVAVIAGVGIALVVWGVPFFGS